ncbi:unnamed protein product [Owenia fusiformis]|uniref:Phosphoinositide phospholipase C n=1 Tax=Owenia fusiformis TaxID=6347 RepID=A0A8S4NBK0_OWEFU|nr:unnamed protein product [Owenia fusiformis]
MSSNDSLHSQHNIQDIQRILERGLVVTKFFPKKKPERRTGQVKLETRQLMFVKVQGRPEGIVDLREVKEIRQGKKSKDFEKMPEESHKFEQSLCFVILFGNEFRLKTLSLVATNIDEFHVWTRGLQYLVSQTIQAPYPLLVERWLRKEFYGMSNSSKVTLKDIKPWLPKINHKIPNKEIKDKYQAIEGGNRGELEFEQFKQFYHSLIHVSSIFSDHCEQYSKDRKRITAEEFQQFLKLEQKDALGDNIESVKKLMASYLEDPNPMRQVAGQYFTDKEFVDFLFSKHNTILDEKEAKVWMDMTQPMSDYWIASSHNTYLTGDQFSSESSLEAYARCLRMGCRCLELDCWDGPDNMPHIYHGHTLTSKIKFESVLKTIRDHAWVTSEYPLVLSIENHCGLLQQRNMAQAFKEIFGDMLVTEPFSTTEAVMPSPQDLRRKIILKHKKLPDNADSVEWNVPQNNEDTSVFDSDLSNSIKNGIMYLEDPVDKDWRPHYFVLTSTKMYYTEETPSTTQTEEEEEEEEEKEEESNNVTPEGPVNNELHFSERWFHGKLAGGRRGADRVLQDHCHMGDGTFLVRESETFVGDYSLSFWGSNARPFAESLLKDIWGPRLGDGTFLVRHSREFVGDFTLSFWRQNKVNHCRIRSRQELGQTKYYLIENTSFDSLYSLICHYRQNPLRSQEFRIVLKEPVPQPQSHEGKPWYHEDLSNRGAAENMLSRIPYNGAFLIRKRLDRNPSDSTQYAISFRAEGKIKHCRIKQDGRLFIIGSAQFESLNELVEYYEKHPLYRKMKLKYPVNETLVEKIGTDPDADAIYSDGMYADPNDFTSKIKVRALYDYKAQREDELSFCKHAVIININKQDGGWWRGDYGGRKQHWFPSNYVEEFEQDDDSADSTPLGNLQKGTMDVTGCIVDVLNGRGGRNYIFRIVNPTDNSRLEIAASSDDDMFEWVKNIRECANIAEARRMEGRKIERNLRIAREFSDLIVYCRSVPFNPDKYPGKHNEMSSFPETKVERWVTKAKGKTLVQYNRYQFSRVYPKGQRIDSSNYDPVAIWNCGSQLLALNYQTPDKPMQINEGRFIQNGRSGYILKPEFLRREGFDPFDKNSLDGDVEPVTVSLTIIGVRHLIKQGRGIASPFVEVEVLGADYDCNNKYKTGTRVDNGFNPVWNETCEFDILNPPLALIRFSVQDEDMFGDPNFLGQATYPLTSLRTGYRSIALKNGHSEELELASLLVHLEMRNPKESEDFDIYADVQELRDESRELAYQISERERLGDRTTAEQLKRQLNEKEQILLDKNEERRRRNQGRHVVGTGAEAVGWARGNVMNGKR